MILTGPRIWGMDAPSAYLRLTEDQQEWYEERAAILEFEAGLRRHLAEAEALRALREQIRAKHTFRGLRELVE